MNRDISLASFRATAILLAVAAVLFGNAAPARAADQDDLVLRLTELDPPPNMLLAVPGDRVLIGVRGYEYDYPDQPAWAMITDGTPQGTEPVWMSFPDGSPVYPPDTWRMGDTLYARKTWSTGGGPFGGPLYYHAALHRVELNAETEELMLFTPRTGSFSSPNIPMDLPAVFGDRMYFFGAIGSDAGPCISDGTAAGTRIIPLLNPDTRCTAIYRFAETAQHIYFTGHARNFANISLGYGLWRTSKQGTGALLVSLMPEIPEALVSAGDRVFFTLRNVSEGGVDLYTAGGSSLGILRIEDVAFDDHQYMIGHEGILGVLNDEVYFVWTDSTGRRLWKSDGTPGGTVPIRAADASRATGWDNTLQGLDKFVGWETFEGRLLFRMRPDSSPWQLWATDGTESGTFMLANYGRVPRSANSRLYFDGGERVHRSMGISGSAVEMSPVQLDSFPDFTVARNRLFFLGREAQGAEKQAYVAYYLPEEPDRDGDGVPDFMDAFPDDPRYSLDEDGDGLPDEWELHWFGDLETADRYSDYSGNGMTDYMCFILGLSPLETHEFSSITAPFFE